MVHLPSEASHVIVEGRPFRLCIEYALENPQAGLHFYIPTESGPEVSLKFKALVGGTNEYL